MADGSTDTIWAVQYIKDFDIYFEWVRNLFWGFVERCEWSDKF